MTDIVAFLNARLDEERAEAEAAQAVDPGPWTVEVVKDWRGEDANTNWRPGHGAATVDAADGNPLWEPSSYTSDAGEQCMTLPTAQHVARHDPARVLREVEAKRRILARHSPVLTSGSRACDGCGWDREDGHHVEDIEECPELRDMASVYAEHADYVAAWAV